MEMPYRYPTEGRQYGGCQRKHLDFTFAMKAIAMSFDINKSPNNGNVQTASKS